MDLLFSLSFASHPCCHSLSHTLFEGGAESTVTTEATFVGQLLRGEGTLTGNGFAIEIDEVSDTQVVDVSVVGQSLLGKILAKVVMVGAYGLSELGKGEVVLQVKLLLLAMPLKQLPDAIGISRGCNFFWLLGHFFLLLSRRLIQLLERLHAPQQETEKCKADKLHKVAGDCVFG